MKFLIDHNLPPAIARALHELSLGDGHLVVPLKDRFSPSTSDIAWITELKDEGGWTVISQDKFAKGDVEKKPSESVAYRFFAWLSSGGK